MQELSHGHRADRAVADACSPPQSACAAATDLVLSSAAATTTGAAPLTAACRTAVSERAVAIELVPVLAAEVALLQARLDEVQRQLVRLTDG